MGEFAGTPASGAKARVLGAFPARLKSCPDLWWRFARVFPQLFESRPDTKPFMQPALAIGAFEAFDHDIG